MNCLPAFFLPAGVDLKEGPWMILGRSRSRFINDMRDLINLTLLRHHRAAFLHEGWQSFKLMENLRGRALLLSMVFSIFRLGDDFVFQSPVFFERLGQPLF